MTTTQNYEQLEAENQKLKDEVQFLKSQIELFEENRKLRSEKNALLLEKTFRTVVDVCAATWGVKPQDILRHRRPRNIVYARHAAFYFFHKLSGWSLSDIGRKFGVHHTAVIYALESIPERLSWPDESLRLKHAESLLSSI